MSLPQTFFENHNIELMTDETVTHVDTKRRFVMYRGSSDRVDRLPYDLLLCASGGFARLFT